MTRVVARIGVVVTAAAGMALAGITWALISVNAIACPDDESEGPSAAPGSPYASLVCTDDGRSFPWIWVATLVVTLAVTAVVVARGRRLLVWALVLLVGPAVLVTVLQLTVPKDCLSGRTDTGDCSRDREQF